MLGMRALFSLDTKRMQRETKQRRADFTPKAALQLSGRRGVGGAAGFTLLTTPLAKTHINIPLSSHIEEPDRVMPRPLYSDGPQTGGDLILITLMEF